MGGYLRPHGFNSHDPPKRALRGKVARRLRHVNDDEWTLHVDSYIDRLRNAQLVPPINGVHLVDAEEGRPVLQIDALTPLNEDLVARVKAVLGSVPHRLRHVPFREDGRRPGVSYGN